MWFANSAALVALMALSQYVLGTVHPVVYGVLIAHFPLILYLLALLIAPDQQKSLAFLKKPQPLSRLIQPTSIALTVLMSLSYYYVGSVVPVVVAITLSNLGVLMSTISTFESVQRVAAGSFFPRTPTLDEWLEAPLLDAPKARS